jgi:peptide/nickel transport system permease protein
MPQPLQRAAATDPRDEGESTPQRHRKGRRRWAPLQRLARRPAALGGLAILVFWGVAAVVWPAIVPYGPTDFHLIAKFSSPSPAHWLGTDNFGRDVLSRILAGSSSVLFVSTSAAALGVAVGTALGLTAAFYGGPVEEILMRLMDILMAFPLIVIALLVIAVLGPSQTNVILVVALAFAPYNARVVRAAGLNQRAKDFVAAARLRGESGPYIILTEILPNISGTILVELTVRLALAIFTVATLSFLGLGIQPPTPDWGLMIAEGRQYYRIAPWIVLFPSLAIASLVIAINLVAEGLAR